MFLNPYLALNSLIDWLAREGEIPEAIIRKRLKKAGGSTKDFLWLRKYLRRLHYVTVEPGALWRATPRLLEDWKKSEDLRDQFRKEFPRAAEKLGK